MSEPNLSREDDGSKGRYVLRKDGAEAQLTYKVVAPGQILADHTFVPPEMRGTGAGKVLVARLVKDARAEDVTVATTCSFVRAESKKHPEWSDVFGV